MMSGETVWCEECQARGKRRQLVLYQWSSDEACYMCQDDDCTFPMGCTDMFKYTIVRNSEDLVSQRRKKRKSSLPPVTRTNHVAAPTPPIICDVSPPSLSNGTFQAWKKPLPIKQGEGNKSNSAALSEKSSNSGISLDALLNRSATPKFAPFQQDKTTTAVTNDVVKLPLSPTDSTDIFPQGLANNDFLSMFSESGNAPVGTSCSPSDWDLDLDDIFPLEEDSVPVNQGMTSLPSVLSNSLTAEATGTTLLKQPENIVPHLLTDSGEDHGVKLARDSVLEDSITCQPQVAELEKAAPHLLTDSVLIEDSSVKQAQHSTPADSSKSQPSEPENVALHSLTDSVEVSSVKQAQHSASSDSSTSQPSEIEGIALHLHTNSGEDGVVKQAQHWVPDSSKSQGKPTAAISAIIDDVSSPLIEEDSTIQWTNAHSLCWLDAAMCMLVHSRTLRDRLSQLNGNGESTVKTLHLAYQQAQELLSNYQKARKTPSADRRSSESRKSPKMCPTSNSEEQICIEQATEILHGVRQKVFESLRPTLRCELGKNESPVFALPLMLRENSLIEDLFRMEYDWEFNCDKCGFTKTDRMTKVLPTFPSVTPDFSLLQACHLRSCFSCGAPEQKRKMVFNRLPPFVMLHFVSGLSHNSLEELDCTYQDRQYRVSAVIRYKTHPDHFVAYIRDTQGNRWLKCDDLSHPVCRWQDTPPSIPPSQIHIVAWELQSNNLPSDNTLSSTSTESSTSRNSLLSDLGSSSLRSARRNSTSSLSSIQYNIDTVDLTTDADFPGNPKNGSESSSRETATSLGSENAVSRLSGMEKQKGVVGSTSPTKLSQAIPQTVKANMKQSVQFRVATARVQPNTAKTNVARNLFTEKPPSPPRMCLAPLPMGKALSPRSQSSQDTKLDHVSSQPNLSKAAPILRSPNSAFTVYNGCGPKKSALTLVMPAVHACEMKNESTVKNPEKKTSFTADAYARQIASRSKVNEGRSKVSKPNTIRHLTQTASWEIPEIVNPSILNRFLRKPTVVATQQTYSIVSRDVGNSAVPAVATDSIIKGRKRALSTGTGPNKRTKVSALRNSTSTAPSSPALSTLGQKSFIQADKQKTLTVNSSTSVSKRKISELLGNKKHFAGYRPRGMTGGNTLPEKRTKYVGQFVVSNGQQAQTRLQSSQKTKAMSPGMQRKTASTNAAQAKRTDLSLANPLVQCSNARSPLQGDREGNNGIYDYKQKDAQLRTTVHKDVPNRTVAEGAAALKTACSQSKEQQSPQTNKKRLSDTMSELCEKLGLPTNNVKMDATVEDNFFDSFFDGDKSMEEFELSPSKDLLCLVADDNVNDSEFCQKLSAISNIPADTSKATSLVKISDSNHNRVARHVKVSPDAKNSNSVKDSTSVSALVNNLSRTLQGSPATLRRKGQFTVAQLLKQRTVQTN